MCVDPSLLSFRMCLTLRSILQDHGSGVLLRCGNSGNSTSYPTSSRSVSMRPIVQPMPTSIHLRTCTCKNNSCFLYQNAGLELLPSIFPYETRLDFNCFVSIQRHFVSYKHLIFTNLFSIVFFKGTLALVLALHPTSLERSLQLCF